MEHHDEYILENLDTAIIDALNGRMTSRIKLIMDIYNSYHRPKGAKVESINCRPCVAKVLSYFITYRKLQQQ